MKTTLLFPALCLAAAASLHADLVLVQKVDGAGQNSEMTMKISGDKVRTDVSPQVSTITDVKTGDVTTLMHQQKSFMHISSAATKAMMEQMKKVMQGANGSAAGASPEPAKLQPTGKKDKINGYDAQEYTFSTGNIKGTYWLATDYPNGKEISEALAKFQGGGLAAMTKDFAPDLSSVPGVPIKSEVEVNGQKVTTELESAKMETVDPSQYQAPADYTEMKMPTMPQQ